MKNETPNQANDFLDIRSPGLVEAVGNAMNLCVWQAIRSSNRDISVAEVAAQLGEPKAQVKTCIDSLAAVGLLVRAPCRKTKHSSTWKVASSSLCLFYREGDPRDEESRLSIFRMIDSDRQREVESRIKPVAARIPGKDAHCTARLQMRLTKADLKTFWEKLTPLFAWMETRTGVDPSEATGADSPQSRDCNYHIALDFQPLLAGVHPMGVVYVVSNRNEGSWKGDVTNTPAHKLSAREREIAEQIALGASNAELATRLKLSPNTIATYVRRVFRKLDITRRSQVALKLHSSA
ncbi:MAG: LuxR family transcriptional regulator [Phycisphaerales bacterium]|nr:LuxR family transcriptional regulator [Phycisphaerales bacterium]